MKALTRDAEPADALPRQDGRNGRMYVVVVGIDRYRAWNKLERAVSDACGARDAFVRCGFTELAPPLLDDAATSAALHRLVTDDMRALGDEDSLVVFFAGHGYTVPKKYPDGTVARRGYLVPVDAEPPSACGTWVNLENWLHDIAHLPAKHILVVIDACHSGIALNPVIRWRSDVRTSEPLDQLRARRSRRIITSALDGQQAIDGGPLEGHSLFTGCLIEALTGGLQAKTGKFIATGTEIALHVQDRVVSYPGCKQTPDFGAFQLDNRGELLIALSGTVPEHLHEPPARPKQNGEHPGVVGVLPRRYQSGNWPCVSEPATTIRRERPNATSLPSGVEMVRPLRARTGPPASAISDGSRLSSTTSAAPQQTKVTSAPASSAPNPGASPLPSAAESAFLAALERHHKLRQANRAVLSFVTADPMTGTSSWARWAASRGLLTLVTDATGLAAATANLLDKMPWLRVLGPARTQLAKRARLDVAEFDNAFDAHSSFEREAWIDQLAGHDHQARVAAWLVSAIREPLGRVSGLDGAPIQGGDLLATLHGLAAPISVLFHHAEPTAQWLERAIQTAAELADFLPRCAIAVSAPNELATSVLRGRSEAGAMELARKGEVPLAVHALHAKDRELAHALQTLYAALAHDPRTCGAFETGVSVPTYDGRVQVDLIARNALLAIEIDDWYRRHDPNAYERDRNKDLCLARAQFFVMRFLVEDVEDRIEQTVEEIAIGLAERRASGSFEENR